jgi:cephalosporin hydroxylase
MKYIINLENRTIAGTEGSFTFDSEAGFKHLTEIWLHAGWDAKYVYSFSWLGRPVIQLPDDMIRMQELIYRIKPTVIIETGVAHGGSLIFYASLLKLLGNQGRVIGVDIDIRPHNRLAIEQHEMSESIMLLEGDAVSPAMIASVQAQIHADDIVMVILDSNHSKAHVYQELKHYAPLVSVGSYIIATDGIMQTVVGAPRTQADWTWNNPQQAVQLFLSEDNNKEHYICEYPQIPFNESQVTTGAHGPSYYPQGWLKRVSR